MLDGHAALQRREVRRQRGHGEAALIDDVLKVAGRLLEQRGRLRLADGDVRAGGEGAVESDEIEQMSTVVHDRDGAPRSAVGLRVSDGGIRGFLCAVEGERVFGRHVVSGNNGSD